MRFALALLLLPLLSTAYAAPVTAKDSLGKVAGPPPAFMYMVARIKITATDLTETVFLRHSALSTLEECEAERNAGVTTGWRYLNRYYLKTYKGFAYEVDYRCAGSNTQELALWRQHVPPESFYLVETRNNELKVTPHTSFFACRDSLRKISAKEDINAFCTLASQKILPKRAD